MKKGIWFLTLLIGLVSYINVNASIDCGYLKNLSVSPGTLTKLDDTHYEVLVPNGTKKVTIEAGTDKSFVGNNKPGTYNASGIIQITVDTKKCGDGTITQTQRSFFFNIKEASKPKDNSNNNSQTSNNTKQTESKTAESAQESKVESVESTPPPTPYLKGLEIKGYTIEFKKDVNKYEIIEEKNVKKLEITANGENDTDKVIISSNASNIKTGTNNITVTVTNSEGGKNVYTIKFVKTYEESSDASLKSLKVKGYDIDFDKDTYSYTLNYKGDTKLDITTAASDSKSKVEVSGNENLKNGSVVDIKVTAEDGTQKSYRLVLQKSFDFKRYARYIIAGAIILFLLFLILIFKPKKRKKAKATAEDTSKKETEKVTKGKKQKAEKVEAQPKNDTEFQIPTEKPEAAKKSKKEYDEVKPNEDEVNVDDHLKIVNPTDVDESSNEESSKTEVFKF